MARSCMIIHTLLLILGTSLALASSDTFVLRHSGGYCVDIIKKANFEYVDLGAGTTEADCASRCEADAQCDFYQTLNQHAYNSGWPPLCQHYRNAYCDPATLTKNHPWWEVVIKESGLPPVQIVTSGPPMTASCSSQPLDYCLRTTWEGGDSPYAPSHNYIWRLADVLNGEPVFVQDGKETEYNGALGFIPDFNLGQNLAGYCAGQTWGAIVLDKSPGYPFINDGVWNWGVAGSCTGTETADILEVLRGQRDSITTAFRARTNSYHAAHRDVKIEVLRDAIACGGRFYSDALFSKSESEQCKIMEAVLPGAPTNEPTASPTSEPSNMPTMNPTLVPTSGCPAETFCDADGFQLAMQFSSNSIFNFDSNYWTDETLLGTSGEGISNKDGKYKAFIELRATEIKICAVSCVTLTIPDSHSGQTLKEIFSSVTSGPTGLEFDSSKIEEFRAAFGAPASNHPYQKLKLNFDDTDSGYQCKGRLALIQNNEANHVTANDAIGLGAQEAGGNGAGATIAIHSHHSTSLQAQLYVKGVVEARRNLGVGRLLAFEDALFHGDEQEFA